MIDFTNGIRYGLSYFTIFPTYLEKFEANKQFYKGVLFSLPIAGLTMGIFIVLLHEVLPFPLLYSSILLSIIYLFLNGFIHLEAVADTIDGYFASLSQKDVYEVMKEPQIGAIGAIGTFCFVLFKILAISYLLYYEQYLLLVLVFMLSRASVFFSLDFTFHTQSHFINSLQNSIYIYSLFKIVFFPILLLTKVILSRLKKQLGFLNGDTIGFNIEVIEIVLLNICILFIR